MTFSRTVPLQTVSSLILIVCNWIRARRGFLACIFLGRYRGYIIELSYVSVRSLCLGPTRAHVRTWSHSQLRGPYTHFASFAHFTRELTSAESPPPCFSRKRVFERLSSCDKPHYEFILTRLCLQSSPVYTLSIGPPLFSSRYF